jgi:hypothetical protein
MVAWLLAFLPARAADPPPKPTVGPNTAPAVVPPKPGAPVRETLPPPKSLDAMKLPTGAVIVLCEQAREALQLLPRFVVLSPEEYQKLQERVQQLEAQMRPNRAAVPSSCKLSGRVEGEIAHLRAEFRFKSETPGTAILLGCPQARPRGVTLDDQEKSLPLLEYGDDGLTVRLEQPGEHKLILDLDVPVSARGGSVRDQGFELTLPAAAITTLEPLDLPDGVPEVRVTGRYPAALKMAAVQAKFAGAKTAPRQAIALGAVDQLDLVWRGPAPRPTGPPLLAAEGKISVRVDDTHVTTDAELTLQVRHGETDVWRLQVPYPISVNEPREPDARLKSIELPTDKRPELIIHLAQPSKEPLRVVLQSRMPRPLKGQRLAIGPFAILDKNLIRQGGTVVVNAPTDLQLSFPTKGDNSAWIVREQSRLDDAVAAFAYSNWPVPANAGQPAPPLLSLEVEPVKGTVETKIFHDLRLGDGGWRLTSRLEVTPVRTGVERLEIQVPAAFKQRKVEAGPDLVENNADDATAAMVSLRWAQKQYRPLTVTLTGMYPLAASERQATLELPRPIETDDRGARLSVTVPEGWELADREPGPLPPGPGERGKRAWNLDRAPARVDVAWRLYRPELMAQATVEVTLAGGTARVRERLRLQSQRPPEVVPLRVPASLRDRLRTTADGGSLTPNPANADLVWATPAAGGRGVILQYSVPLLESNDSGGRPLTIPLIWPEEMTRGEAKVLVWPETGVQAAAGPGWDELPVEVVAERETLPSLVLRSTRSDVPLTLRLAAPTGVPLATVVADRTLIQGGITAEGYQFLRARFRLTRLQTRRLEIDLPASPDSLKLEVLLDGKKVPWQVSPGEPNTALVAVELELYRRPTVLELRYEAAPGRVAGSGMLYCTLVPPRPRGEVLMGPVRWAVALPAGWTPVCLTPDTVPEQRWSLRGWLVSPRPIAGANALEEWFHGSEGGGRPAEGEPTLVCRSTSLEPLCLAHVPQQVWLLCCSAVLVAIGLLLVIAPLPRWLFWATVLVLLSVVAVTGMIWPGVIRAVAFGVQLGVPVLALVLGVEWWRQSRYRRRVNFLPGFRRVATGSSLARTSQGRLRREPSTIDAPRPQQAAAEPHV